MITVGRSSHMMVVEEWLLRAGLWLVTFCNSHVGSYNAFAGEPFDALGRHLMDVCECVWDA